MLSEPQKRVLRRYGDCVSRCATGHHQKSDRSKARCRDWAIEQSAKVAKRLGMNHTAFEALADVAAKYSWFRYRAAFRAAHGRNPV